MDKKSEKSTNNVESTPRVSRWDKTPAAKNDLNADAHLKRQAVGPNETPRNIEQTPSRFS